jgi:hypothetical protein
MGFVSRELQRNAIRQAIELLGSVPTLIVVLAEVPMVRERPHFPSAGWLADGSTEGCLAVVQTVTDRGRSSTHGPAWGRSESHLGFPFDEVALLVLFEVRRHARVEPRAGRRRHGFHVESSRPASLESPRGNRWLESMQGGRARIVACSGESKFCRGLRASGNC